MLVFCVSSIELQGKKFLGLENPCLTVNVMQYIVLWMFVLGIDSLCCRAYFKVLHVYNTVCFSVNCFPLYVKCGISWQARCMQNQLWRTAAKKRVQCVIQEQLSWQDAYGDARKPVWEVWTNGAKVKLFKGECLLSRHETGCIQLHQKTSMRGMS